jgi:hypothetical protein
MCVYNWPGLKPGGWKAIGTPHTLPQMRGSIYIINAEAGEPSPNSLPVNLISGLAYSVFTLQMTD